VKAGEEEIARSLEGNWQEDQLFVLKQEQDNYEFCQKQIAQCDQLLQQYLLQQEDRSQGASLPEEKRRERLRKKKKGKIIGKGRLPTKNRASIALRMAASTLRRSNTYLGAQFRRLRTKLGAPVAIKAMAAKLARLVYRMLRYGMQFVDQGAEFYEIQNRNLQIHYLKSKAAKLGLQIIDAPAA
jgi:transposase